VGICSSSIFFYLRVDFWLLSRRGANKKTIFSKRLFGCCSDREQMKTLRFEERRMGASDITRLQRKRGTVNSLCSLPKVIVY